MRVHPSIAPPDDRVSATRIVAVAAAFAIAFIVRWMTLPGLQGDDHWPLWTATTFLKGDRPFRDFLDLGDPLYWAMSALAQYLVGYRVIGEVALGTALIAFAFAAAFHMAWRASGSLAVATILTALGLTVVTARELYVYPKVFVYPLVLWLAWRYIDRPTVWRSVALAVGVAGAFGYRHDHGAYTGVGAAAAVLAAHWAEGLRGVLRGWIRFGIALLVVLGPYLLLIQMNEGLVQYFRERIGVAAELDATSRRAVWFEADPDAPSYLFRIDPPHPARVFVDWKPEVTPALRTELEHTYSLTNGVDPKNRSYEYILDDVTPANVTALAADPRIADKSGLSSESAPEPGSHVEITWRQGLDPAERTSLERRYGLRNYRNNWEYTLTDVSTDNIRAIVQDSRVFDTGLIERETFRPMEESSLIKLQRSMPLFRISIAPRYWHQTNAGVLLHYIAYALPYVMLLLLALDWRRGRRGGVMAMAPEKMFATAIMMAVAHWALLRRTGYFADHTAAAAILAGCVWGHVFGPGAAAPAATSASARPQSLARRRPLATTVAAIALMMAFFASVTFARGTRSLQELNDRWLRVWPENVRAFQAYNTSPPIDEYAPRGVTGDRAMIRYIYECTRPDDRVWVLSDLFTFPYYTERRIVGHIYWAAGFFQNEDFERKLLERVDKEDVPLIVGLGGSGPLQAFDRYPLVRDYVAKRYTRHYSIPGDSGRGEVFWILTDSRRTPSGTFDQLGLPCFK